MKKAIILIDDEKIVLNSLKIELSNSLSSDFEIELAESGEEAFSLFHDLTSEGYDIPLVISDFIMPEMKGDEVLEKIKLLSPKTYSILLTGHATMEGVINAINKAGLYRYIAKPWESTDLAMTIKEALKSYEKDEQLLKLDSAKSYFIGLLSHELTTPLIGINGNAKLIYEITDDPEIKESAESILICERRLRKFAELSMLITRIQTDKYKINFHEESLIDIIENSIFNFNDKLKSKNIIINRDLKNCDFNVQVDVGLLTKVFEFILDNSIKFSPENSNISISGYTENSNLIIQIKDDGIGFSDKSLKSQFHLFSSTDDLLSHSEGTGLSLAAAKVIMNFHNFEIIATNSNTGGALVQLIFK